MIWQIHDSHSPCNLGLSNTIPLFISGEDGKDEEIAYPSTSAHEVIFRMRDGPNDC